MLKKRPPSPTLPKYSKGWFWEFVKIRFGLKGVVFLVFVIAITSAWWNFDKLKELPISSKIIQQLSEAPLPRASGKSFAVGFVHLEDDRDNEYEKLLREELKNISGIEVLEIDRSIAANAPRLSDAATSDIQYAKELAKETGVNILLWGTVIHVGNKSMLQLHWISTLSPVRSGGSQKYRVSEELELPPLFWTDLQNLIRLIVATYTNSFWHRELRGEFIDIEIQPYLNQVETLLEGNVLKNPIGRAQVQFLYAKALLVHAGQVGDQNALIKAIILDRQVLNVLSKQEMPNEWAATQYELGSALRELGDWNMDINASRDAIKAFKEALTVWQFSCCADNWGMAENELGNALRGLGIRLPDVALTTEAVSTFQEILAKTSRNDHLEDWSAEQCNLGIALSDLGRMTGKTRYQLDAINAFNKSLEIDTRERAPINWAKVKMNLGATLRALGESEAGTGHLLEAVSAYREASTVLSRKEMPLLWAEVQHNMGNALRIIGIRENSTKRLEEALEVYRGAREEFVRTQSTAYVDWIDRDISEAKSALAKKKDK